MSKQSVLAAGAAAVTVVLWASAFVAIRHVGHEMSPGALSLGRLLVGSVLLGILVFTRPRRWPAKADWKLLLVCGLLWFGVGLTLGAVIGMLVAFVATPMNGEQARQKISEQVDKVRRSKEESSTFGTNGSSVYGSSTTPVTPTPYERS